MKLQHTSGAVIEVGTECCTNENASDFFIVEPSGRLSRYAKPDWQRVPEDRWEKVSWEDIASRGLRIEERTANGAQEIVLKLHADERVHCIDGNLCVERRVEG